MPELRSARIAKHGTPADEARSVSRTGLGASLRESASVLLLAAVFLASYLLVFIFSRQVFAREIIFYDALACLLATAGAVMALWLGGVFRRFGSDRNVARVPLSILLFVLLAYSFAITVPALINRSVSFFMITNVTESGAEGITAGELESRFIDQYVIAYEAIPRRLEEQLETGNFRRVGDRYLVTPRGEFTYDLQKFLLTLFRTSEDYSAAEISD